MYISNSFVLDYVRKNYFDLDDSIRFTNIDYYPKRRAYIIGGIVNGDYFSLRIYKQDVVDYFKN